jgi:hypothetical protein
LIWIARCGSDFVPPGRATESLAAAPQSLYALAGDLLPQAASPSIFVKTLLTRTIPLLLSIAAGALLSWVSIYAFWFSVVFHSVPALRACEAMGNFLLLPARGIFELTGADQSAIFFDPISFAGTNGLILGLLFYAAFRMIWNRRESKAR